MKLHTEHHVSKQNVLENGSRSRRVLNNERLQTRRKFVENCKRLIQKQTACLIIPCSLVSKLRGAGWGDELDLLDEYGWYEFSRLKSVNQPNVLSERGQDSQFVWL